MNKTPPLLSLAFGLSGACGETEGAPLPVEPEPPAELGCPERFSPERVYGVDVAHDPDLFTAFDLQDPAWTCTFAAGRGPAELQVRPSDGALVGMAHRETERNEMLPNPRQLWRVVTPELLYTRVEEPEDREWLLVGEPEDEDELLGMPCDPADFIVRTLIGADGASVLAYCEDPNNDFEVRDAAGNLVYLLDVGAHPLVVLPDGRLLNVDRELGLTLVAPGGEPVPVGGIGPTIFGLPIAARRVGTGALIVTRFLVDGTDYEIRLLRLVNDTLQVEGLYDVEMFYARELEGRWALEPDGGLINRYAHDPAQPMTGDPAIVRLRPDGSWETLVVGADKVGIGFLTGAPMLPCDDVCDPW